MDYQKLSKIVDSSFFRKGDIVFGTTEGGLKVKGPVISSDDDYVEIKGPGNSSYQIPISSARNLSLQERDASKLESRRRYYEEKLHDVKEQIEDIWNSPEMEDWYGEHPDYTGEDYPDEFKDQLIELEKEQKKWEDKLDNLK